MTQINAAGTVNLGNSDLSVTSTRAYQDGDVIVLVQNDGADSVSGTFVGLSEASTVIANGVQYMISYAYNAETSEPDTGNDVALIAVPMYVKIEAVDAAAGETGAGETADPGQFVVTRYGGVDLSQSLTVTYSIGGTAANGSDYNELTGSVTIPVGATSAPIDINILNDSSNESSETVVLTLTGTAYTIDAPSEATVTIDDNDQWQVAIEATDPEAEEPWGGNPADPGQFTITRSGESDLTYALPIAYTVSGTATNGSDYELLSGTVAIPAGATSATIPITPLADEINDDGETVVVSLSTTAVYTIGAASEATVTIIQGNIYAPVFTSPSTATVAENTTEVLTVTATDADLPAQTLVYSITGGVDQALFTINSSTGELSFTGAPDYETPADSDTDNVYLVEVTADDQSGLTTMQAIQVTVTPVNETPVAVDDAIELDEGATAAVLVGSVSSLLANDSDPDTGDTLAVDTTPVVAPQYGTVTLYSDGTFSYTHDGSESFSDSFVYQVRDTGDLTSTATVTITVTPVNDNAPVFSSSASADVAENTTAVVTVAATDADLPAQTLVYSITGGADQALFTINSSTGELSFSSAPDYETPADADTNNVYLVEVTADDQSGLSTMQAIQVTVTPVNDNAPVFSSAATADVAENTTAVVTVVATDADLPGQTLVYSITGGVDQALFTIDSGTGELSFTSAPDYETPADADTNNVYLVEVTADDQSGLSTMQAIQVTVTPVNETPVAVDDAIELDEGATATVLVGSVSSLLANDTDPDAGDTLTLDTTPVVAPQYGTVTLYTDGTFSYTHDDSENFTDGFVYQMRDAGGLTSTATVTITVTPVNDNTPVFVAGSSQELAIAEDCPTGTPVGTASATDADQPGDTLSYSIVAGDAAGAFAIDTETGAITIADAELLDLDYDDGTSLVAVLTVQVSDEVHTATQEVTVTVTAQNDTPVAAGDAVVVEEAGTTAVLVGGAVSLLDNDSDRDAGDTLTVDTTPVVAPQYGTVTLYADGTFSYTHDGSENFSDTFVYQMRDVADATATATVYVLIVPGNDNAPVFTSPSQVTVAENGTAAVTVEATDDDLYSNPLCYSITGGADAALFTIDEETGEVAFSTAPDYEVPSDADADNIYLIEVTADDQEGGTASQSIQITVSAENDNAPVFSSASSANVAENTTAVVTVAATDADLPAQTLAYSITRRRRPGSVYAQLQHGRAVLHQCARL